MLHSTRQDRIFGLISEFLRRRKLKDDKKKKDGVDIQSWAERWLTKQFLHISKIEFVTHPIKAIHPSIVNATSLCCPAKTFPQNSVVGTHCLPFNHPLDAICHVTAFPIVEFLQQEFDGTTLLDMLKNEDQDLLAVLEKQYNQSVADIKNVFKDNKIESRPSSHTLAKQLYWLIGDNPCDDQQYHLLSPLFSSPLSSWLHGAIQETFSKETKEARKARKKNIDHPKGYCEYSQLAVEKRGGGNPQNVSFLNRKCNGEHYLLTSLPPIWKRSLRPFYHKNSAFDIFARYGRVKSIVNELYVYLLANPDPVMATRNKRDDMIRELLEELVQFSFEFINGLEPGWSALEDCYLPLAEQCWLDPFRSLNDKDFSDLFWSDSRWWTSEVTKGFSNFLNNKLVKGLPVGDSEFNYWYSKSIKTLVAIYDAQKSKCDEINLLSSLNDRSD